MCTVKNAEHPKVSAKGSPIAVSGLRFQWLIIWSIEQLKMDLPFSVAVAVAAGCASSFEQLVFSRVRLLSRKLFKGILKEVIHLAQ